MKLGLVAAAALLASAAPAAAERLEFDYRLSPPLQQVLDSGDKAMVDFNADNPARLVDLIAVKGSSAKSWSEALEIISIARPKKMASAAAWMEALKAEALARCPAQFTVLAHDAASVTYERRSDNCPGEPARLGLYRLVAGKRSWFQLAVLAKDGLDDKTRAEWLALLASAHLN